uniref:Uncharacterized protein n=1 Tax=Triticum urartu TaxID=4572 RepID=A0A8R7P9F2_TRIUA
MLFISSLMNCMSPGTPPISCASSVIALARTPSSPSMAPWVRAAIVEDL